MQQRDPRPLVNVFGWLSDDHHSCSVQRSTNRLMTVSRNSRFVFVGAAIGAVEGEEKKGSDCVRKELGDRCLA